MRLRLIPLAVVVLATALSAQTPIDANATGAAGSVLGLQPSALGAGSPRAGWSDDFDRASGTVMGPDWTEWTGDLAISANHGMGNLASGWSYMLHTSASAAHDSETMWVDLLPPTGSSGPHVALIAGAAPGSTLWFYTKIQDNDSNGAYDRIFFYSNGNGGGWGGLYYQDLVVQVTTARVSMYFTNSGDRLNVDLDVNFDGIVDQHYQNDGAWGVTPTGTGFGIGTWAMGAFDNWRVGDAGPRLAVRNLVAGGVVTIEVTSATPGGTVRHGYSLAGGGPVNTPWGTLLLSPPYTELPAMTANASGAASFSGPVPPGTTGISVWLHAFDLGSLTFTNGIATVIG